MSDVEFHKMNTHKAFSINVFYLDNMGGGVNMKVSQGFFRTTPFLF